MDLKLDPEAVQSIASAAIFEHLGQEARDSIVKQAVEHLLTPEKSRSGYGYGAGETPIQKAFDQAITAVAYKVVKEQIENDPAVQERILEILGPLLVSATEAEAKEGFDAMLADRLGSALGSWLADVARRR